MKEFGRGVYRAWVIVAGFLPIAMSFGAVSIQSGLSDAATVGMSVWVFAGASQFAALEGVRQNLPWFSIVLTMLVINLRHIPMSFAAKKIYGRFSRGQQLLLCHGLLDETFALESAAEPHGSSRSFSYYAGIHCACWGAWVAGTWIGCQVGTLLPERWLHFALPSLFLYLLSDGVSRRWSREVLVVLGVGIALVLVAESLGTLGTLVAIIGVSVVASFLPGLDRTIGDS